MQYLRLPPPHPPLQIACERVRRRFSWFVWLRFVADGHSSLPPCVSNVFFYFHFLLWLNLQVNIQVQRRCDEASHTHAVMLFQQLMKPPLDTSKFNSVRRNSQQQRATRLKVVIFTITQGPSAASARTTFVKPTISVDDCLTKSIYWFSRLFFSCVNGCVVIWLPGCVFTILAMNFTHPCIGGFTLDAFRYKPADLSSGLQTKWVFGYALIVTSSMHCIGTPTRSRFSLVETMSLLSPRARTSLTRLGKRLVKLFGMMFSVFWLSFFAANSRILF